MSMSIIPILTMVDPEDEKFDLDYIMEEIKEIMDKQ